MGVLSAFFSHLALGIHEAVSISNLWYCFVGVFLGCLVGALPGLGALVTISLLLPVTYHLSASGALIMLAGVYFGSDYGGGTCSILLGVPGTVSSAVDVLDGYPMAQQGRGGIALFMKCVASAWGSLVGIVVLMLFAPPLSEAALQFGPADYCSLMLLGLLAASTVGQGSPVKGIAMMIAGMVLGIVGTDVNSGVERFSFGVPELSDGIGLVPIAMGMFAIAEVIRSVGKTSVSAIKQRFGLKDQLPTREDWRRSFGPMLRGSGLGAFLGALPGTSGGMGTFLSYAIEKRISKHPERFGKGTIEGIAGPEACNNAGVGSSFIPTLTLGIPGDVIMALMLGALMMQGIEPGPQVLSSHPELFWGLIVSFWIGNIFLVILNIPFIGMWVRLLMVPYSLLYPGIILFTCIGVYSTNSDVFDIYVLLAVGAVGYAMQLLRFSPVPLLLGLVLGPPFEEYLRRALLLSRGDFGVFVHRPISGVSLAISALLVAWSFWSYARDRAREASTG